MRSDIRDSLHSIRCPFLGVYGGKDLHVNPVESPEVYRRRFRRSKHPDYTIRVFPNANHSLLREEIFGTSGEMGFWELLKLYWMEEMAFVPGFLDLLVDWSVRKLDVEVPEPRESRRSETERWLAAPYWS